jgi:Fur family peroxide stress response transcriptional regulator
MKRIAPRQGSGRASALTHALRFSRPGPLTAPNPDGNRYQMAIDPNNPVKPRRPPHRTRVTDARSGDFERLCRQRGIRVTPQRMAVHRLLTRDSTHPTAEDVYGRLRRGMASLSFATVYRVLECLEREGFVRRFCSPDGAARYEANMSRHYHFVCRLCGCIIDCEDGPLRELDLPRHGPAGFVPDELEIRILGICSKCRRARRSGRPADVKRSPTKRRVESWQH